MLIAYNGRPKWIEIVLHMLIAFFGRLVSVIKAYQLESLSVASVEQLNFQSSHCKFRHQFYSILTVPSIGSY